MSKKLHRISLAAALLFTLLFASCTESVRTPTASASVADPSKPQQLTSATAESAPTSPAQMSLAQLRATDALPGADSARMADYILQARTAASRAQDDQAIHNYALALLCPDATDENPLTAQALLELSRLLVKHGYSRAAIETYQRLHTVLAQTQGSSLPSPALESLAATPGRIWAYIAKLHADLEETTEAIENYAKAEQLSPADPGVRLFCARGLGEIGEFDRALDILDDLVKDASARPKAAELFIWIRDQQGKPAKALQDLKRLRSNYPDDSRIAVVLASYYRKTDQLDKARNILIEQTKLNRKFLPAYQALSSLELQADRPTEAVKWLARMVRARNAAIFDARWRILRIATDKTRAAELLSELTKDKQLTRDFALAWAAGTLAESADMPTQAQSYYRRAIALRPRLSQLYLYLVRSHLRQGQADQALDIIAQVQNVGLIPSSDFYPVQGLAYLLKDDFDSALICLEAAIGVEPTDDVAREVLAGTLLAVGRPDEAALNLQYLLSRTPEKESLLQQLIFAHLADGRADRAVAAAQAFMADHQIDNKTTLVLAQAFLAEKRYSQALQLLEGLSPPPGRLSQWQQLFLESLIRSDRIRRAKKEFSAWLDKAESAPKRAGLVVRMLALLADAEKSDLAIKIASDELRRDPKNPLLREMLISILIEKKDYSRADSLIAGWLAENFDRHSRILLAQLLLARRDYERAETQLTLLLSKDPQDIQCLHLLASLYELTGKFELACQQYRKILDISPADIWANNNLGFYLADAEKQLDDAERMIRLALRSSGGSPAILDSMGWAYYKRGRFGQALVYLSRAVRLEESPGPEELEHLGDTFYRLTESDQAIDAWQGALAAEQASDQPDARRLKRLQKRLEMIKSDQTPPVAWSIVDNPAPPPLEDE